MKTVAAFSAYLSKASSITTPPISQIQLRRAWLPGLIREVRIGSRGTNGYRLVHAELTIGMGIRCSSRPVSVLMTFSGAGGLPGPTRVKRLKGVPTASGLEKHKFNRENVNEL